MEGRQLPDTSALATLSYELSLRTLSQQEATLNELRARTGTLIAAASIVTSFLGGAAISKHGLDAWGVLALVGFVGSIALATWVLLPKEHLIFSIQGPKLDALFTSYRWSTVLLLVEVVFWIVQLAVS